MSNKISTRAIILKRVAFGDADWIVTFFSRDYGRMSGIARSARKSLRRFGSGLEPGAVTMLTFTARANSDLVRLEESQVIFSTTGVMKSLGRIEAHSKALRFALSFLRDHQAAPEKFDLLEEYIAHISAVEPSAAGRLGFELKWLSLAGFEPQLDYCSCCGSSSAEAAAFSAEHGGIVCNACNHGDRNAIVLSSRMLESMRDLRSSPIDEDVSIDAETKIAYIITRYVEHILGHPLMKG